MKVMPALFIVVFSAVSSSAAEAQARKYVVTSKLDTCAVAVANVATGKAGGGATGEMSLTCTVADRGRTWECISAYPGEEEKSQQWTLTTKAPCEISAKSASCILTNAAGTLRVAVAASDGLGLVQLRLDLDAGNSVATKVCAGTLTMGVGAGWFCGATSCARDRSDCNAFQAAFAEQFPDEPGYKERCVPSKAAYCISGEQMCFIARDVCEQISKARSGKPCVSTP